ncbi:MAG: DUF3556 domain-containing protein [Rhodococcus sp. (in: high G+C Gram-positive bacteria)]|uniref:DUF3556 domain-containing protein n=1 Tax=Rhodococcus sp. TaxID=1831 RepID=UPI003BB0F133
MGFKTADMPPVDPAVFGSLPFLERMKLLALHWAEYGFGGPKQIHMLYVIKLALYVGLAVTLVSLTPGLGAPWEVGQWWTEPIFYQKVLLFTVLWEVLGLGASSGPLAFRFSPMMGGALYWFRPGTLRNPPWPGKVPFTAGTRRSLWDVTVYAAIVINLLVILFSPGVESTSLDAVLPNNEAGLVNPSLIFPLIGLLLLMGLRDKVVFLASRAEQYIPAMIFFSVLPFVDMIIALKLLIVVVWMGAGVSKFGRHFSNVVPPMMSNAPFMKSRRLNRSLYRNFPEDIRPSKVGSGIAHICGTVVELVTPLVLLFSTNVTVTVLAIIVMVGFHLVITATFPLAVPLEWNILFAFATVYLFWNYPAGDGFGVGDMSSPWLTAAILAGLLFFPVLGNLRPDLVSFLPSMRQYAGNWASATWAFAPGAEEKLNVIKKSSSNQVDQLTAAYGPEVAEIFMQKAMAWRTMHSQGRALVSMMINNLDDIERYTLREAEFTCSTLIGWQFGDGHLHNEYLVNAVQELCNFEPGELVVAWIESQPIHKNRQEYKVIDAALGVIERGSYLVKDAVDAQPWLPEGPIPFRVDWSAKDAAQRNLRDMIDTPPATATARAETPRTMTLN